MVRRILNLLLALGILGAAVAAAYWLYASRPLAAQAPLEERAMPVQVLRADPRTHAVTLHAMGEIKPAAEVLLQPEVSGKVLSLSPNLVPGGRVSPGEVLVRVDKRDYATLLAAQESALEQARVRREEERSLQKVAEHEWQGADVSDEARQLALREPHLRSISAQVESAQSQLKKARRDLEKTAIRAPFEGIVLDEYVDPGQIVAPGVTVARIAGTERFWVQVSVPISHLDRLRVPGVNTDADAGSAAEIVMAPAPGVRVQRDGYVGRLLGSVDPRGRMAQLLLVIEDPLQLALPAEQRSLPMLIGSYVEVELEGRPIPDAVAVPIEALKDGDRLWIVVDGKLELREVQVAWRETDRVLVGAGLAKDDLVVVSPIPTATEGMPATIEAEVSIQEGNGPVASVGD